MNHPTLSAALRALAGLLPLLAAGCGTTGADRVEVPAPPHTEPEAVVETLHGAEVADPYRWLEDQEAPRTREWITEQNEYTDSILGALPGRERLREIVTDMLQFESIGAPVESPWLVHLSLSAHRGGPVADTEGMLEAIVERELAALGRLWQDTVTGGVPLF